MPPTRRKCCQGTDRTLGSMAISGSLGVPALTALCPCGLESDSDRLGEDLTTTRRRTTLLLTSIQLLSLSLREVSG